MTDEPRKKEGTPSRATTQANRGFLKTMRLLDRGIKHAGGIKPEHRVGYESPEMAAKRRNRKLKGYRH